MNDKKIDTMTISKTFVHGMEDLCLRMSPNNSIQMNITGTQKECNIN